MRAQTNWSFIYVGYASLFVLGFLDNTRGPFFPDIIRDLSLSDTGASLFFAVASFLAVVSGRLTPWIVEHIGLINLLRMGHVLMGIGCLGFSRSGDLSELLAATTIFGFGFGLINVGQNIIILKGASASLRRRLLNGLHSIYALASLFAPLLISFLTSIQWTWRQSFQSFSLVCVFGFLSSFFANQKMESEHSKKIEKLPLNWSEWFPYCIAISFYIAAELALTTRFVLYVRRDYGVPESTAAQMLSLLFFLLLLGRLLFTFVHFPGLSNRRIILTSFLLSAVCLSLGLSHHYFWLVLCGLTMAPCFGIAVDYLAEIFGPRADRVVALVLALSGLFIVGMHWLIGLVTDLVGLREALFMAPAMLVASTLIMWAKTRNMDDTAEA